LITLQRWEACANNIITVVQNVNKHIVGSKGGNHRAEGKQYNILMEYHKPYAKEIRESIRRDEDSKTITHLQTLRKKSGLTRPKEDYEELDDFKTNPYSLLFSKKGWYRSSWGYNGNDLT
jgi:hypothetical protein